MASRPAAGRVLVLAPSTAYQLDDFTAAAARLGVELVLGTDRCHVLAEIWPAGALALDFREPERAAAAVADHAAREPLDGIVATDEKTALIAALAARRLGLPHNPVDGARAAANKLLLRRRLAEVGVAQPAFRAASIDDDPDRLGRELAYPVVIKPVHLSASRGVMRADDPAGFTACFRRLQRLLADPELRARDPEASRQLLIEAFVPGVEVAFEGLLAGGRLRALALFDKPDPLDGPFFEETIYVAPSRLPAPAQEAIAARVAAGAAALALCEGPLHAELRVGPEGPVVLEIAARAIGGLCSRMLRFGTGLTLQEVILAHAAGRDLGALARSGDPATGVLMLPVPAAGVLRAVDGIDAAAALPGVREVAITARVGDVLVPLPEGHQYLGFVFATGADPAEVVAALRRAGAALRFQVAALL